MVDATVRTLAIVMLLIACAAGIFFILSPPVDRTETHKYDVTIGRPKPPKVVTKYKTKTKVKKEIVRLPKRVKNPPPPGAMTVAEFESIKIGSSDSSVLDLFGAAPGYNKDGNGRDLFPAAEGGTYIINYDGNNVKSKQYTTRVLDDNK